MRKFIKNILIKIQARPTRNNHIVTMATIWVLFFCCDILFINDLQIFD